MAMAADTVIVTAEHIVPVGVIAPDHVVTPGAAGRLPHRQRVSHGSHRSSSPDASHRNFSAGNLVNLGIGIPTLVANYVPAGLKVFFQSENGLIGTGPIPSRAWRIPC